MKNSLLFLVLMTSLYSKAQQCSIIPYPNRYASQPGTFTLDNRSAIAIDDPSTTTTASYLQNEILKHTGITIAIQSKQTISSIKLAKNKNFSGNPEAYSLEVGNNEVRISAANDQGLFYGVISFLQLIRQAENQNGKVTIGCLRIEDSPGFGWRGLMLDESRHFFGKEAVKSILDWMAFYKLNRFHWHLTDASGWRLQILAYPKLTLIGGVGDFYNPLHPAQYYTQEDIREIIRYAAERYISIIPEIDMPGHATAANIAYPQFSGGGSVRYPDFTFNPGNDSTYKYLGRIIKETDALFPSQMIHLGGDEVSFGSEHWNFDPAVKKLMQGQRLKDLLEVEQYFNKQMADSLFALENKLLCWDEAVESNLPIDKTIICWWRHDKPEQLKKAVSKGFPVIICPRLPFYLDFVQDTAQKLGRRWKGSFNSFENLYNFSVKSLPIENNQQGRILGMQAALWTEVIATREKLEYMLFPRIAALAETTWTQEKNKNFDNFVINLKNHLPLYRADNIYYYNPFAPQESPEPLSASDRLHIEMSSKNK